jgi:hypothetical protein
MVNESERMLSAVNDLSHKVSEVSSLFKSFSYDWKSHLNQQLSSFSQEWKKTLRQEIQEGVAIHINSICPDQTENSNW